MERQHLYITADGYRKLHEQLEELRTVKRPVALRNLQAVSGGADWRESAEQTQLQERLALLDAEIHKIKTMLADAEVVQPQNDNIVVDIGETVVLEIDDMTETYTIVGPTESDPDVGHISYESPLGSALLKRQVGEEIDVTVPMGELHYRIVAVC